MQKETVLNKTELTRQQWGRYEVCIKCDWFVTNHKTGTCAKCREVKCHDCKKVFLPNRVEDVVRCGDCNAKHRGKMRRIGIWS